MAIFANEEQLRLSRTLEESIFEEFVNHDGILYKLYSIFDIWYTIKRSSFKNVSDLDSNEPFFFRTDEFNSSDNSKNDEFTNRLTNYVC